MFTLPIEHIYRSVITWEILCLLRRGLRVDSPVGGLLGAQPIVLDKIGICIMYIVIKVMYLVYMIHILPSNIPGIFHSLPCYWSKECGELGGFHGKYFTYIGSRW